MLTTESFPLALAFFSFSRRRFALQIPISSPSGSALVFFDLTSQDLECLDRITDLPFLFTGLDVLLDQLAHPFVYRLLSGSYTLFEIRRIRLSSASWNKSRPVTHGAPR
jgi:hypothetical protein